MVCLFKDIGDINAYNLKVLRRNSQLKQREVAAKVNMSLSGYKRWEQSKCFDTDDISRLAKAFGLEPVEVFIQLNKGLI